MDSDRSQLSITLPRNFMFHYRDAQPPRTPEPESKDDSQDLQPPPPPRQTFKVRRRRTTAIAANHAFDCINDERPIPTIEAPELHSDVSMDLPGLPSPVDSNLLSPVISFGRMLSPPKTPVSQMRGFSGLDDPQQWSDIDQSSQSESSSRPTSSSGFSDSSVSSRESFESFPSLGESCSSPEDDMMDPLVHFSPELKGQSLSSPFFIPRQSHPQRKLKLQATFTDEMDYHLWMTYLKYLQDPTVTPFKALPSTVPPNGVCHRVARMARKTWKGPRSSSCINIGRPMSQCASRCDTPDTIKPGKSGSCTPVPGSSKPFARFPTEKQCRKQLRDLAKQKPSLSAHYQRLVNHRSPSPFQSTPPEEQAPPDFVITILGGRCQLLHPRHECVFSDQYRSFDAIRQSSVAVGNREYSTTGSCHVVGSSFSAMSEMTDASLSQHNSQTWHAPSARPPRLGSPLQLHAPRPIARPFKRRALLNFEDQVRNRGNSFVDQLFGAPAESSHRRVRSRGFSLGDMMEGARRARKSATNTTGCDPFVNTTPEMPKAAQRASVSFQTGASTGQGTIRLGSPFGARPSNTFPRASTTYGFEPAISFEQRLAALPSDPTQLSRS
ncbi:hypothetical protein B0J11DRAFT_440893 [Dendryphion nanum]|uniref:Uncharacterized protein n=1 Tax=Dendryphion nanum TaxID=256645 RepID=A0A9P9DHH5_9PLEO|nr:hypothetical protein B0J11DRAFT_440893 [Dendryphion nanum]